MAFAGERRDLSWGNGAFLRDTCRAFLGFFLYRTRKFDRKVTLVQCRHVKRTASAVSKNTRRLANFCVLVSESDEADYKKSAVAEVFRERAPDLWSATAC